MTRHIDFEGIENFRDFGGYATACGRGVRRGVLYRSANHAYATEADLQRMRDLGLAAIIDLRRPEERAREPSKRWPGFGAAVVENDILSDHPDWADMLRGKGRVEREWFRQDALEYYRIAPFQKRHIDLYTRYFRTLAEVDGAIVVHCAAGKDRTGLICALTHHITGVSYDDLMADYLLTNDESRMARKMDFLGPWLQETCGVSVDDEALRLAVSVQPEYLETAFEVIRRAHGSLDAYLEDVLGVDAALRERIHERLLGG
ncbi:tyrosine-protein phosphatase [Phenylobacterium sp.]|jgi:protein tyrosine/serine phosphatase|uniref:tyrosine-protein phosphatase n=1 Tax=Phenylobacterium sp. TaxID=1871053 RepID=UPI002F95A4EA